MKWHTCKKYGKVRALQSNEVAYLQKYGRFDQPLGIMVVERLDQLVGDPTEN